MRERNKTLPASPAWFVPLVLAISAAGAVASSSLSGQEPPEEAQDTTPGASRPVVAYVGGRIELPGVPAPGGNIRVSFRRGLKLSAQLGVQTKAWTVQYDDDLRADLLFSARLQVGLADQQDRFELGLFLEGAAGFVLADRFGDTYGARQVGIEVGFGSGRLTWFGDVSLGTANRSSPDLIGQLGVGVRYRLSGSSSQAAKPP